MSGFRSGVRLGIDVGSARVGVSRCDPEGLLAVPVETIARGESALDRVAALCEEYAAMEIVVGLPTNLRGADTASTKDARAFALGIAERCAIPVRLVDERLSTVSAHAALRHSGRSQRASRNIVDQVAAVVVLQHAIDVEKSSGIQPGVLIHLDEESD